MSRSNLMYRTDKYWHYYDSQKYDAKAAKRVKTSVKLRINLTALDFATRSTEVVERLKAIMLDEATYGVTEFKFLRRSMWRRYCDAYGSDANYAANAQGVVYFGLGVTMAQYQATIERLQLGLDELDCDESVSFVDRDFSLVAAPNISARIDELSGEYQPSIMLEYCPELLVAFNYYQQDSFFYRQMHLGEPLQRDVEHDAMHEMLLLGYQYIKRAVFEPQDDPKVDEVCRRAEVDETLLLRGQQLQQLALLARAYQLDPAKEAAAALVEHALKIRSDLSVRERHFVADVLIEVPQTAALGFLVRLLRLVERPHGLFSGRGGAAGAVEEPVALVDADKSVDLALNIT